MSIASILSNEIIQKCFSWFWFGFNLMVLHCCIGALLNKSDVIAYSSIFIFILMNYNCCYSIIYIHEVDILYSVHTTTWMCTTWSIAYTGFRFCMMQITLRATNDIFVVGRNNATILLLKGLTMVTAHYVIIYQQHSNDRYRVMCGRV